MLFSCECVGTCNNVSHEKRIDVLHDIISNVVKEYSKICNIKQKYAGTNFCWSKKLSELKQKALNAHKLWVQCNEPKTGPVNLERIQTKCEYRLVIKRAKNLWDRKRKMIN